MWENAIKNVDINKFQFIPWCKILDLACSIVIRGCWGLFFIQSILLQVAVVRTIILDIVSCSYDSWKFLILWFIQYFVIYTIFPHTISIDFLSNSLVHFSSALNQAEKSHNPVIIYWRPSSVPMRAVQPFWSNFRVMVNWHHQYMLIQLTSFEQKGQLKAILLEMVAGKLQI